MLMSLSAFALAEEEAGFDEYELGVEGEQEVGFMTMAMVYFQPVDMAPADLAAPKEGSDLHIEVDLTANENPYGFPVDGWVPYLSIDYVIKDTEGKEVATGSMMPMAASDGPHQEPRRERLSAACGRRDRRRGGRVLDRAAGGHLDRLEVRQGVVSKIRYS